MAGSHLTKSEFVACEKQGRLQDNILVYASRGDLVAMVGKRVHTLFLSVSNLLRAKTARQKQEGKGGIE